MSFGRGGARGSRRGGGLAPPTGPANGAAPTFRGRGGRFNTGARHTINNPRGGLGGRARGNAVRGARGTRGTAIENGIGRTLAAPINGAPTTKGDWADRYQALRKARDTEREDAIRRGLVADPNKPIRLSEAITPVGTCQHMCAEFERVERAVRNEIWEEEKVQDHSVYARTSAPPDETRMVKVFKRSAAGYDEQLPSDLRPPHILKETCDYLFHTVIGQATSLAKVHHFVWDRTRAVRNDFSIQQVTKPDDLRIAIDCYERIARFHIVSLHQLALKEKPYDAYDPQQEREQLDRTLLSLVQYYDDSHGRIDLPNEAEFRAYQVLFQLQQRIPDLEDRVQTWPSHIQQDPRVQAALKVYARACNTEDLQGPFGKLPTTHVIARQDWQGFWEVVLSGRVTYLMGCVAEIYFNLIRQMTLKGILRSMRVAKPGLAVLEWDIDSLMEILNFDTEAQLEDFCNRYGLGFREGEMDTKDGSGKIRTRFLDTSSLTGRSLPEPETGKRPTQLKSQVVEEKREGRSIPAVIDGLSVRVAQEAGMTEADEPYEEAMDGVEGEEVSDRREMQEGLEDDNDSLFVPDSKESSNSQSLANETQSHTPVSSGFSFGQQAAKPGLFQSTAQTSPFARATSSDSSGRPTGGFGQPSASNGGSSWAKLTSSSSPFAPKPTLADADDKKDAPKPAFSFSALANPPGDAAKPLDLGKFNPSGPSSLDAPKPSLFSGFGQNSVPTTQSPFTQKPAAGGTSLFPSTSGSTLPAPASSNPFFEVTRPEASQVDSAPIEKTSNTAPLSLFPNSATAASPSPPPETTFKSASPPPQQSHTSNTASTSTAQPTQSTQDAINPTLNNRDLSPTRRQSINAGQDTKPKKPSPLSNYFTASEDSAVPGSSTNTERVAGQISSNELFPGRVTQSTPFAQTKSSAPAPAVSTEAQLDTIVARLAEELVLHPTAGYLKQLIDHYAKALVSGVQEKIYFERIEQEATEFRQFFLEDKYGRLWRDLCRRRRLKKIALGRRKRAQKRLRESQGGDRGDTFGSGSPSEMGSAQSRPRNSVDPARAQPSTPAHLDALFRSTNRPSRSVTDRQARVGRKRPASSIYGNSMASSSNAEHKRTKSAGHGSRNGSSVTSQHSDLLERSSFLGFSLAPDAPHRASTTNTTYFRMKALGIKPTLTQAAGTKRPRSESLDAASAKLQASSLAQLGASTSSARDAALMPPPASTRSVRSKADDDDDDEALFARLRAARESLKETGNLMKSEIARDEEFRRSRSASQSDHESPSMERARSEARLRSSLTGSDFGVSQNTRDVPAYRLRESRFVPRESYSKAIERANEIRASRSRDNSRPPSRIEQRALELAQPDGSAEPKDSQESAEPRSTPVEPTVTSNGIRDNAQITTALSALENAEQPKKGFGGPSKSSTFTAGPQQDAPNPFSQSSSFAPVVNAASNPFLQAQFSQSQPSNFSASSQVSAFGFGQASQRPLQAPSQATATFEDGGTPTNPFPAFSQQPSWSFTTAPEEQSAEDHTIQPEEIPAALSYSFGQPPAADQNYFATETYKSPTSPQTDVYSRAASNAISLLSDEEEGQEEYDEAPSGEYSGQFAALANYGEDGEDGEDDSLIDEDDPSDIEQEYSELEVGGAAGVEEEAQQEYSEDEDIEQEYSENEEVASEYSQVERVEQENSEGEEVEEENGESDEVEQGYREGEEAVQEYSEDEEIEGEYDDSEVDHDNDVEEGVEQGYSDEGDDNDVDGIEEPSSYQYGNPLDSDELIDEEAESEADDEFYANSYQQQYEQQAYHAASKPQPAPQLLAVGNNEEEPIELDSD